MRDLPDTMLLREMSIPGTHDSCAREGIKEAVCQEKTVTQQLYDGIRFFDLRLDYESRPLSKPSSVARVFHGPVGQPDTFSSIQDEFVSFLKRYPGETILVSIKQEEDSGRNSKVWKSTLALLVRELIDKKNSFYYSRGSKHIRDVDLKSVRRKIVLIDRSDLLYQTMAFPWSQLEVQAEYEFNSLDVGVKNKLEYVKNHMQKYLPPQKKAFMLNFLSFCDKQVTERWKSIFDPTKPSIFKGFTPEDAAAKMNPRFYRFLIDEFAGDRVGTILMDFPDKHDRVHMIGRIVSYNFREHQYQMFIKTGDVKDAGTDANVYIQLNGSKDNFILEPKFYIGYDAFEQNALNEVKFGLPKDIGDINSVTVWFDRGGRKSGWCLEYIQITDQNYPGGYRKFNFDNQWFYSKESKETRKVMPADYKYRVRIETANEKYAGTDANVTIQLNGEKGTYSFDPKKKGLPGDAFEQGQMDEVQFSLDRDLGKIKSVTVWHDGHGKNSGWCLKGIYMLTPQTQDYWQIFGFGNQWFYSGNEKKSRSLSYQRKF
jgi:hypothetical protein